LFLGGGDGESGEEGERIADIQVSLLRVAKPPCLNVNPTIGDTAFGGMQKSNCKMQNEKPEN